MKILSLKHYILYDIYRITLILPLSHIYDVITILKLHRINQPENLPNETESNIKRLDSHTVSSNQYLNFSLKRDWHLEFDSDSN